MNETQSISDREENSSLPSLTSRLLHLALALGISLQLLLSTFMQRPRPDVDRSTLERLGFGLHEIVGLGLMLVILVWFVWLFRRRDEPSASDLFPWLSQVGRGKLLDGLRQALREARTGRLAAEPDIRALARTVHGLGALCALFMAVSGTLIWLTMQSSGAMPVWGRWVLDTHQAMANLMWAYLIGHAAMAVLHHWQGEGTLARMFFPGEK